MSLLVLWNSAFKWVYRSFSPLLFASLLFTAICKASSDNHFAFLHFLHFIGDEVPFIYFCFIFHDSKRWVKRKLAAFYVKVCSAFSLKSSIFSVL